MLKATRVDGVYSADPEKDPNAKFYKNISFEEAISKIRIMDGTALTLAKDHKLPIKVFNLKEKISIINFQRRRYRNINIMNTIKDQTTERMQNAWILYQINLIKLEPEGLTLLFWTL